MDGGRLVTWVQGIAASQIGRRPILHALVGAPLGGLAATLALPAAAKRRRKKRKKKKNVTFNDFGCVDVGRFCANGDQCCSGICQGKKGKKTCQAHDQSTCQPGQSTAVCGGEDVDCTSSSGDEGFCITTTGNAGYCLRSGKCFACTKDADCVPVCGSGAACIVCAECNETGGTACAVFDGSCD